MQLGHFSQLGCLSHDQLGHLSWLGWVVGSFESVGSFELVG